MKKILLSFAVAAFGLLANAQTPCPSFFDVLNNGGGGACPGDFPGNSEQAGNNAYKRDGLVSIRFASSVGGSIIPVITAIRAITSPIGQPVTTGPTLDMKFSLRHFVAGSNQTVAEYCFFSQLRLNLNNASGSRYQVDVSYFNGLDIVTSTCNIQQQDQESPLAVRFKSFAAKRSNASAVSLSWTTATEQNCKGFYIQKNTNGGWKTAGFVSTQAQNGGSVAELNYAYTDINNEKGVSQYRLQQVDLDGKISYSDIRAIRGGETVGKVLVYPNPGVNGKVNVLLEETASTRNVEVTDMQGRIVKNYVEVTDNLLVIDGLKAGFYAIKVTDRSTSVSSVQKVIIR